MRCGFNRSPSTQRLAGVGHFKESSNRFGGCFKVCVGCPRLAVSVRLHANLGTPDIVNSFQHVFEHGREIHPGKLEKNVLELIVDKLKSAGQPPPANARDSEHQANSWLLARLYDEVSYGVATIWPHLEINEKSLGAMALKGKAGRPIKSEKAVWPL